MRHPSEELIIMLSDFEVSVGELALGLREIILKVAPQARETLYKTYEVTMWYSLTDKVMQGFCHVSVHKKHVNLGFFRGVDLNDPDRLLEGSGKQMRHIKIRSAEDLKQPHIKTFVKAAVQNSRLHIARDTKKK